MCGKPVAAEGPEWHALRNATFQFPDSVSEDICHLIAAMMGVTSAQRPTATECLRECSCVQSSLEQEVTYLKGCVATLEGRMNPLYQPP